MKKSLIKAAVLALLITIGVNVFFFEEYVEGVPDSGTNLLMNGALFCVLSISFGVVIYYMNKSMK